VLFWITSWSQLPNCWEKQFHTFMPLRTWRISKKLLIFLPNVCDVWYHTRVCTVGVRTVVFTHETKTELRKITTNRHTHFMNSKSDINTNFKPGINKPNKSTVDSWLRELNRASRWSDYRKCRIMWKFIEKPASENLWIHPCLLIRKW
jgi:hypothetical protein